MKYFKTYELVDQKTFETMGENALTLFTPEILIALDNVREFFGEPMTVNNWHEGGPFQWRGYRTFAEADILLHLPPGTHPGQEQHAAGNAFDFDVHGMTAEEVRQTIVLNKDNPLLVNITRLEANVSWVHMDAKALVLPQTRIHVFLA